jgi:ATPase family protein associated with various cellular activities (AAA)
VFTIDWASFTKKKVPHIDDYHGIYFVCGRQGSGKTYMAMNYVKDLNLQKIKIVTNVHSLKLPHENFQHITDIINDIRDHTCYVIDEVSKKYPKNAPPDRAFYAWLQQSRKRKRVVILITQEWKELPMWLRRPTKFAISTKPVPIIGKRFGWYLTVWGDGENMTLDESMEWVCPPVKTVFHKRNRHVADLYDTFEPVESL